MKSRFIRIPIAFFPLTIRKNDKQFGSIIAKPKSLLKTQHRKKNMRGDYKQMKPMLPLPQ